MHPLIKQFHFVRGVETHTFTAIGRCPRTGRMGISVSTGELAVGSRVPFVKPNVGVVESPVPIDLNICDRRHKPTDRINMRLGQG